MLALQPHYGATANPFLPGECMSDEALLRSLAERVGNVEEVASGNAERYAELLGDVREIKAQLRQFATTQAVLENLAPLKESVALLSRDVSTVTRDLGELTKKVGVVFDLHEAAMREKGRADQAAAERARELAEAELQKTREAIEHEREKHQAEIKAIQEAAKEGRFFTRFRKTGLPFIGGAISAIIGLAAIISGIFYGIKWLITHYK